MPDFYVTVRKYVHKKAPDELISIKGHDLYPVIVCIVTPLESDLAVLNLQNTIITDCYPVGIPAQVLKNSVNAVKRRLAIYYPFLIGEFYIQQLEYMRLHQMTDTACKFKLPGFIAFFEVIEELPPKQIRHNLHREEVFFLAGYPAAFVMGQPAAGNNAVYMGMIHKVLAPSMQYADESDTGTEAVIAEFYQCL